MAVAAVNPDHEGKLSLPRGLIVTVAGISVAPFLLSLLGVDFSTHGAPGPWPDASDPARFEYMFHALRGSFIHTLQEWSASTLAFFSVVLAFAHFRVKRDVVTPIIGVALLWAGCMDMFHTLAADRLLEASAASTDLIPFTWAICRTFSAVIPLTAFVMLFFASQFDASSAPRQSVTVVVVAGLMLGVSAFLIIRWCATSPDLPQTMFPDALIKRPYDIAPLGAYLISALYIYPRLATRLNSFFFLALWLSVLPDAATQLHMAFGSGALFDSNSHIAHFLKIVAYACPCIGLILDYIRTTEAERLLVADLRAVRDALELKSAALEEENWFTTEVARICTLAQRERDWAGFGAVVVTEIANACQAGAGTIYRLDREAQAFVLAGGYAVNSTNTRPQFQPGEGLVGECASQGAAILVEAIPEGYMPIRSGLGECSPVRLLLQPILFDGATLGVFELATTRELTPVQRRLITRLGQDLGVVMESISRRLEAEALALAR